MKSTLLTLMLSAVCQFCFAQKIDFSFDKKTIPIVGDQIIYTRIDTLDGKNKGEIYDAIASWVALNFNNSKAVLQLGDKESGKMILKGSYRDNYKFSVLGSESAYFYKLQFTMDITIKDNKYRCVITPSEVDVEGGQSWPLMTLYARIPDNYDFKKLGYAKRSEMYRAKQVLNNTNVFASANFLAIKDYVLKKSRNQTDEF